jgi:hypothetical protein
MSLLRADSECLPPVPPCKAADTPWAGQMSATTGLRLLLLLLLI